MSAKLLKQRINITFLVKMKKNAIDIYRILQKVCKGEK
jgi:hypothetical protein